MTIRKSIGATVISTNKQSIKKPLWAMLPRMEGSVPILLQLCLIITLIPLLTPLYPKMLSISWTPELLTKIRKNALKSQRTITFVSLVKTYSEGSAVIRSWINQSAAFLSPKPLFFAQKVTPIYYQLSRSTLSPSSTLKSAAILLALSPLTSPTRLSRRVCISLVKTSVPTISTQRPYFNGT